MICDNCTDGYVISNVTGNEDPCTVCEGTGELTPCDNYNRGNTLLVFRNARCINCGARENSHIKVKA